MGLIAGPKRVPTYCGVAVGRAVVAERATEILGALEHRPDFAVGAA